MAWSGREFEVSRSNERKQSEELKEHGDAMAPKEEISGGSRQVCGLFQVLLHRMAKAGEIVKVDYGRYVLP